MLPPQITVPTFLPLKRSGCASSAAIPAAPAPSATIFCFSAKVAIAVSIAVSSTSMISLTKSSMMARVILPGFFTAIPSARVWPPQLGVRL